MIDVPAKDVILILNNLIMLGETGTGVLKVVPNTFVSLKSDTEENFITLDMSEEEWLLVVLKWGN